MIGIAIQVLWLLVGVIVLGAVIWLVLYVIRMFTPVPPRVEQALWVIFLILIMIALLTLLAGGSIGGYHLGRLGLRSMVMVA